MRTLMLAAVLAVASCCPALAETCGLASWYGRESGRVTASGEHFDGTSLTAAHRTLPFGTRLKVTYRGKSVVVRINDRGGFHRYGRVLDLSRAAFAKLAPVGQGVIRVCFTIVR